MTLKLVKPTPKRPARKRPASDPAALVLRKPTDEIALKDLAVALGGRPVPGVRMSEAEYEAWCDSDVNAEWVDGEVILMAPVSLEQADYVGWLLAILRSYLEDHDLGKVLGPEFTVRLARQRRRRVPDVLVVLKARLHLLRSTFVDGAPDVAFEIVGPESVARDWRDKYNEYEAAGVREYWIFDPLAKKLEAYALRGRKYHLISEDEEGRIVSRVLKGFYVRTAWLWKASLPRVSAVLRELAGKK